MSTTLSSPPQPVATTTPIADTTDLINVLAGIGADERLRRIRAQREQARLQAQQSYRALFAPTQPVYGSFTLVDRFAVAVFVARLHGHGEAIRFYAQELDAHGADSGIAQAIAIEASRAAAHGPYGHYPLGPLSSENSGGTVYAVADAQQPLFGKRLSAALAHAHLLVFHPRDANAPALQALLDAGWSSTEVVTLSQLVAFLAFQLRVATGLQALAQSPSHPAKQA